MATLQSGIELTVKDFEWLPAAGIKNSEDQKDFLWRINDNIIKIANTKNQINRINIEKNRRYVLALSISLLFLFGALYGFLLREKMFLIDAVLKD